MYADHKNLLFHAELRWLSRGNVLQRVFDVRVELKEFLMVQGKAVWASLFLDEDWLNRLCYLSDIFERLNVLNLSLQGRDSNILVCCDKLSAFQGCIDLWTSKVASGHHSMFPRLSLFVDDGEASLSEVLKALIVSHFTSLKEEFQRYFPDLDSTTFALVRNPFTADVNQCVPDDEDAVQEGLITLTTDSGAKDLFQHVSLSQVWCGVMQSYPRICDIALRRPMPFPSTYLCKSAFSTMLTIISKASNWLQL